MTQVIPEQFGFFVQSAEIMPSVAFYLVQSFLV